MVSPNGGGAHGATSLGGLSPSTKAMGSLGSKDGQNIIKNMKPHVFKEDDCDCTTKMLCKHS